MTTTIIIPTLNEQENIKKLIPILKQLYPQTNIIITDDGSKDKTQEIAKQQAKVIDRTNEKIKGLTASILQAAKETNTENIIVMDADFQHPPEKIKEIIEALKTNDIVIGTREKIKDWPIKRRIISKTATLLARLRVKAKDPMSGFFGIKTQLLKNILKNKEHKFEKTGYKVLFDTLKYAPKNTKTTEVYYQFGSRDKGQSKIRTKHIISFLRALFK